MKWAILAVTFGTGLVAFGQTPARPGPKANIAAGKELYHEHCSVCHGVEAKGNGSMYDPESSEPERRVPPTDLTALSERNAGKFPADRVRNAIYNKGRIPAHGTPEMPAWGDVFYSLKSNPKVLEKRVRDLTAYIESIQTTKKE
ncbi:MAG: cytochrome c [Acidobacteriia bacterium]|nr:cytochrome c [Terriglobia bacterium]